MPAKFHEVPRMCLQGIKETECHGQMHERMDTPLKLRFGPGEGGIKTCIAG